MKRRNPGTKKIALETPAQTDPLLYNLIIIADNLLRLLFLLL